MSRGWWSVDYSFNALSTVKETCPPVSPARHKRVLFNFPHNRLDREKWPKSYHRLFRPLEVGKKKGLARHFITSNVKLVDSDTEFSRILDSSPNQFRFILSLTRDYERIVVADVENCFCNGNPSNRMHLFLAFLALK